LCGRLTLDFADACNAYAARKGANGGGRATNLVSLRRFCAIAANVNSNWAPHGPRNRNRPSRKKCANFSTRFRGSLEPNKILTTTGKLVLTAYLAGITSPPGSVKPAEHIGQVERVPM